MTGRVRTMTNRLGTRSSRPRSFTKLCFALRSAPPTTWELGKREWSAKIPFGPYLALGALVWMFAGPQILAWYLAFSQPAA